MKRLFLATMMACSTSALTALTVGAQGPGGGPPMPLLLRHHMYDLLRIVPGVVKEVDTKLNGATTCLCIDEVRPAG